MDAGKLINQITLLGKTQTRDAMGGVINAYAAIAARPTVAACVEPIRGREFQALAAAQSDVSLRITIYYRDDITAANRVRWRDRDYEIDGEPIDVNAKKEWLELNCKTAQT